VLSALAELHLAADHYAKAATLYGELAERDPDNAAYLNNLAWTLAQQGDLEPALEHARKAVELAPENAGVLDTLGLIHLRQGNASEARQHLAKAAKTAPQQTEIQLNYAEALIAAGDGGTATGVLGQLSDRSLSEDERARVQHLRAKLR
jgi:Flp pilus assembly protein TadD